MSFNKKTISMSKMTITRFLLIEYVHSSLFHKLTNFEDMISHLKENDIDVNYDIQAFEKIWNVFIEKQEEIKKLIEENNSQKNNLDSITKSILMIGVTELYRKIDVPIIIKEMLKISDFFQVNSSFINAVLYNIHKKHFFVEPVIEKVLIQENL